SIPATVSEAFALECGERLLSAVGPLAEVETCVELGKRLGFLAEDLADDLHARIEGVAQAVGRLLEAVGGQGDREEGDYPGRPLDDERGYLHDEGCCEPPRRHPHHGEGCCEPPRRHRHHGEGCCEPPRRHRHHGEGCCEPPRRRR
ncbi:MAG: hypothetical protein FJ098_13875, partial [Deltaproteobacteria bacterium]|nr:hypothetical protein [Deltaproteobacteria bacterium]